jgi:hypothetical protein
MISLTIFGVFLFIRNPMSMQHLLFFMHLQKLSSIYLGAVRVLHVPPSSRYADIFTKGIPHVLFTEFRSNLHVASLPGSDCGGMLGSVTTPRPDPDPTPSQVRIPSLS